jgi:uncharacterized iron-regulated membrane protein
MLLSKNRIFVMAFLSFIIWGKNTHQAPPPPPKKKKKNKKKKGGIG